jgi:predicted RNA-binding protein associated with RNAse of E/G family
VTTQREIAQQLGLPIHPPKVELFDLEDMTNTDPKQIVRAVDEFRLESFGLYMARSMAGHPTLSYLESWLLPALGIRVSKFRWLPGHALDQDYYLDIVDIDTSPAQWKTRDYYLDITVRAGRDAEVVDVDEFLTATRADILDRESAQRALERTYRAVDGLARHQYDPQAWLQDEGCPVSWFTQP